MKRVLGVVTALVVASLMAGCATGGKSNLTFAQQVQITCAAVNGEIGALKASNVFTGGALNTLNTQVQPDINAVCTAGASVTTVSLQNLLNVTMPVVITAINNSSLSSDAKGQAVAAVSLLSVTIDTALAMAQAESSNTAVTLHLQK